VDEDGDTITVLVLGGLEAIGAKVKLLAPAAVSVTPPPTHIVFEERMALIVSGVLVTEIVRTAVEVAFEQPAIPPVTVYDCEVVGLKDTPLVTPPDQV
jgi:hypothetical protein